MAREDHEHEEGDDDIARLLRLGGEREALPAPLKHRWEAHFRKELDARHTAVRRRDSARRRAAACAAFVAVVIGVALLIDLSPRRATQVTLVHAAGRFDVRSDRVDLAVALGEAIPVGSVLTTGEGGHVGVLYDGYDLRLRAGTHVELNEDSLWLRSGVLFVSSTPDSERLRGDAGLLIRTRHGSVRNLGTQFMVSADDRETRATVREGTIRVEQPRAAVTVTAGEEQARRATLVPAGSITVTPALARGSEWRWIHDASPGFTIEGRSALEFLRWAAEEEGLDLRFASPSLEARAGVTMLRGDLTVQVPDEALDLVLATSDLSASMNDLGQLIVRRRE